jgi:hypothetical protein
LCMHKMMQAHSQSLSHHSFVKVGVLAGKPETQFGGKALTSRGEPSARTTTTTTTTTPRRP